MKVAFVFPGQGTQYVGMGEKIYQHYDIAHTTYETADAVMNQSVSGMCFRGPEEELLKTVNQQPTIHTTEVALLRVIESFGIHPDVTAGFSLGEYAALVCAGVLRFEDTVQLVRKRGMAIQSCVPMGIGKMASISGLKREQVEAIVREVTEEGVVECSNYNCPGQIIVSGHNKAVDKAVELAAAQNAKRASFLKVSAPFHTSLLKEAGTQLHKELDKLEFSKPKCTFIPNVTAKPLQEDDDIKLLLDQHVSHPVLWEDTVKTMAEMGVNVFVEIGPSASLSKFNRRTLDALGHEAEIFHVQEPGEIDSFVSFMKKNGR